MHFPRKSLIPVMLALGLFGTPALASAHAPGAPGSLGHPPVTQHAALPQRKRRRRRIRRARARFIAWINRRVRGDPGTIRARGERLQLPASAA